MHKTAIYLGTFIGGITFTGSLTAFGKLQGLLNSNALNLPGKNAYNISMGLASIGAMGVFMSSSDVGTGMAMLGKFCHVVYCRGIYCLLILEKYGKIRYCYRLLSHIVTASSRILLPPPLAYCSRLLSHIFTMQSTSGYGNNLEI